MPANRRFLLFLALAFVARAAPDPSVTRLTELARVWITAEYFHPSIAYKNIDWNATLVSSLPKIRSARSGAPLASAYNELLSALNDSESFAVVSTDGRVPQAEPPAIQRSRFHRGLAFGNAPSDEFFSGFLIADSASAPRFCALDLKDGVRVWLRISEPVPVEPTPAHRHDAAALDRLPFSEESRLLGAFRLWGAVRYFFAYKDLIDEDWDAVFAGYLPKFIAAHEERDYHLAIAELVSHLSDGNALVESESLRTYFGTAAPSVRVRLIEKKPVLTALGDDARQAGAKLGDVITKVDGESSTERVKREANYLSASTPASLGDFVSRLLLHGPASGRARLSVARAGGFDAELELPRSPANLQWPERSAAAAERTLARGYVYIDLEHFSSDRLRAAFASHAAAPAVILDFRGPCAADPFVLTEPFRTGAGRQAMIVTGPSAAEPDLPSSRVDTATSSYFRIIRVPDPPEKAPEFRGKVVALIDERTGGPAERALLLLAAAAKVQTIGSPTAGAPSETLRLRLPGSIAVKFSGHDIRLTNGGAIQRQGIQPVLTSPVTLAGIRAGRDEPLDVAVAWLNEELAAPMVK